MHFECTAVGPQGIAQRDELLGEQIDRAAAPLREFRIAAHLGADAAEEQMAARLDQAIGTFTKLVRDAASLAAHSFIEPS